VYIQRKFTDRVFSFFSRTQVKNIKRARYFIFDIIKRFYGRAPEYYNNRHADA
jgi:hypothetical protein